MNKTGTALATIVVVLLIIGGIYYWARSGKQNTENYNTPPVENTNQNNTDQNDQDQVPTVSTKPATYVSKSGAVLNGEVNPQGSQTSYWYEYGEASSLGASTSPQLIGGGNITYSAPRGISGLKANTTYNYRIAAENQYGKVFGEIKSFTTTNTPAPLPLTYVSPLLQTKNATAITSNSAILNGTINANGPAASYWFEYGTTFGLGNVTSIAAASASRSTISVSTAITNLQPNTTYYYRLDGQNVYGTVVGNISVFTTQPTTPAPPVSGKTPSVSTSVATNITTTTAQLNGSINPNGSATTYYFRYGKSSLFGLFNLDQRTENGSAGGSNLTGNYKGTVTGLDPNTTYYYQLVAENKNGSVSGAIFSFTTKSP